MVPALKGKLVSVEGVHIVEAFVAYLDECRVVACYAVHHAQRQAKEVSEEDLCNDPDWNTARNDENDAMTDDVQHSWTCWPKNFGEYPL